MSFLQRLFRGRGDDAAAITPLYSAIVTRAREPHWYLDGRVPDTIDGRFDMIAAIMAAVLIRLEDDPAARAPSTHLAEVFMDDMVGQLREIGVGDVVVGKHAGRMMSALGGRLTAYRTSTDPVELKPALVRNIYRGVDPGEAALDHVAAALTRFRSELAQTPSAAILAGTLPPA
ncbi:ubiquinol-cytochrome C chaperone family protein [Sphingomonas jejuensis]|uniref:ubiquinol-cytochrome C chaperone family protein n=1 Tax=Sphingomonas jejuensis TaxID=904715 RepID=UPI001438DFE9|nr:ubiquinol-cytochrome C chaperone family protein [Sphingomonas jejuensis]